MDPVTIITTVVTLSKALMAGIDVISTIMEQKKFESVILQVYTTHIRALVRDLRTIKRQINALGWASAEADRVPDITVEWDDEQQDCWSDIKEAEEELTGYLEHFKAIVSWIIDNGLTWRSSPGCRKQKYDEVGYLMGQIVASRESIKLSLNCIAAIQNRRTSSADGSTIPLLPPTPRPSITPRSSITSIDARSIHPSSLRRPSSEMRLSPGSSTSSLMTQPMEMRRPSTLSLPSPPPTPTPRPSLKLLSCRSLRLSNYLPRTHRSFDFLRISPSGNYIALLTRRGYSILNLRYQNPQTSPTAIVIRIGPDKLSNSKPALAHFGCAAINDECLVVGTPQAGELLVVPFKTDQQPFKLPIACDAIVLMEFSPTGKELLVLGRSSDWKIQSAFIFTVDYESRDGQTVLNLGLCGEPFKWEERKGRCQTIASWSQGSKFIAISSTTAANGKVQIRLLTKRSSGKKGWYQRLQPKEILVENVNKQDCRPDCKITAHSL
jgi:hypothetical protein